MIDLTHEPILASPTDLQPRFILSNLSKVSHFATLKSPCRLLFLGSINYHLCNVLVWDDDDETRRSGVEGGLGGRG